MAHISLPEFEEMTSDVQQIVEAVAITGYFNYINTLSNVFALGQS